MKLRIKGNSIRLRLGRTDVQRLSLEGLVEEHTDFGPSSDGRLTCVLEASLTDSKVSARFAGGRLEVHVPDDLVDRWAESDEVSIDSVQPTSDGDELRILIEKDFECIDGPPDGSQQDAFPNPHAGAACVPATAAAAAAAAA
jgi:hypothetical protein